MSAYRGADGADGPRDQGGQRSCASHASAEEWAELVVGRAFDALEPGDDARLNLHLAGCAPCRTLLLDMTHVAGSLAYGVEDAEPPAALRAKIRAALPVDEPVEVSGAPAGRVVVLSDRAHSRRPGRTARTARPGRSLAPSRGIRRFALAAAGTGVAAALALTGAYAVNMHSDRNRVRTALAAESAAIHDLQSDSSYTVSLSSGDQARGAAIVSGRTVDLVTAGLDRNNTSTSQYVLWASAGPGQPMRAVRGFDVTASGVDVVRATLPASVGSAPSFAVSEEQGRALPIIPGRLVLGVSTAV